MDGSSRLFSNQKRLCTLANKGICTHPTYCSCSSGYPFPPLYVHNWSLLTYAAASIFSKTALVNSWVVLLPRISGVLIFLKQASVE